MANPAISEPVHYVARGSADGVFKPTCCAAIVTSAPTAGRGRPSKKVDLFVMTPTGNHHQACLQDEDTKAGGTWHYPHVSEEAPKAAKGAKVKAVETVAEAA